MAKRDKKMTGRFREERQLLLPCMEANEPNQGGIIEGRDGKWYFLTHHGSGDWSGRIVSLLPVEWREGWPMMGSPTSALPKGGGSLFSPGTMVWEGRIPVPLIATTPNPSFPKEGTIKGRGGALQRSDDFDEGVLGPQWQWNYQPRAEMFSLSERPGWLRLKAFRPLENDRLLKVGNTLTQRSFRSKENEVTIRMDISQMADGQHAGLCHFAAHSGCLGVMKENGQLFLELRHDDKSDKAPLLSEGSGETPFLWLRSTWGLDGQSHFSYSLDGDTFIPFGDYKLSWGYYRGDRIGIYCYNNLSESGFIDVDYLHYRMRK